MITIFSDIHRLHSGENEILRGRISPSADTPNRVDVILARIREVSLGEILAAVDWGVNPILRVHTSDYLGFLSSLSRRWQQLHGDLTALPQVWSFRGQRKIIPQSIYGEIGYFSSDAAAAIGAGTWEAAVSASNVALTGADLVLRGAGGVFALTRPPGHHASSDSCGGYCYLNNAAIAAQSLLDQGFQRVAILDLDYHHGNGTQTLFYDRADVLFVSLHATPALTYPYFSGYADETGSGSGEGFTVNCPLSPGTKWPEYAEVLSEMARNIVNYRPDAIVVSLGVDTFVDDPLSIFGLMSDDFYEIGQILGRIAIPTLFVLEGGYATESLGINVVNVLSGFDETSHGRLG